MPKVSAEHRERVRESILDAAFACLLEDGAKGVTARAIGRRAGLAAGTIYLYFDGKEDLFATLAERVAAYELAQRAGPDLDRLSPFEQLRAILDSVLTHHRDVVAVPTLREMATRDKAVRTALERFDRTVVKMVAPLVEKAMEDGAVRTDLDAEAVIEAVDIFSEGLASRTAYVTSRGRVVRAFIDLITEGASSDDQRASR